MVIIDNMDVDFRVFVFLVVNGEKIVIRILNIGGFVLKKE